MLIFDILPNDAHFASYNIFKDGNDVIYLIERTEKLLTLISNSIVIQMIIIANPIDRKLKSNAIAARRSHTKVCRKCTLCKKCDLTLHLIGAI